MWIDRQTNEDNIFFLLTNIQIRDKYEKTNQINFFYKFDIPRFKLNMHIILL